MKKIAVFLVMLLTVLFSATVFAAIPSISGTRYIKTFGMSTANNTPVYTNARLNQQGTSSPFKAYRATIYASDEIYVFAMNNTYSLVSYPTSSGRKQGYVRTSSLTYNNFSQNPLKSRKAITVYRRPGGLSYGSIYNGDSVWTVARQGNYTQVVYPAGNVYKMAWITNNDYNNYIAPARNNSVQPTPKPSPTPIVTNSKSVFPSASSVQVVNASHSAVTVDTLNGVNAIYPGYNTAKRYAFDSDTTYSCAAFVKKYYLNVFGFDVSGLGTGLTPINVKQWKKFTKITDGTVQAGDIIGINSGGHWAIAKGLDGNNIVLIEQNWWYSDTQKTVTKNRRVNKNVVSVYRWIS